MKLKDTCSLEEKLWHLESILTSRDITLPTKVHTVKAMVFSVVTYTCESWTLRFGCLSAIDMDQGWALKNWCFWTVMLEKTLESPLDSKGIKPVNPKGNQSWIFTGRTDAETEAPVLWSRDVKSRLIRKDWCWERLKPGGEEDDRWWDGWMTSLTQWTRVWASSGRWWRTGKPGVLQSMGLQRDTTERLNWAE